MSLVALIWLIDRSRISGTQQCAGISSFQIDPKSDLVVQTRGAPAAAFSVDRRPTNGWWNAFDPMFSSVLCLTSGWKYENTYAPSHCIRPSLLWYQWLPFIAISSCVVTELQTI